MAERFEDQLVDGVMRYDHEAFQRWRESHPRGYFLNCRSPEAWMLHRCECPHVGDTSEDRSETWNLTEHPKVCSRTARSW
jgi:hypothetical protein